MEKKIDEVVTDKSWNKIFKANLDDEKGSPNWHFNIDDLARNMNKQKPDVACWHESYGLWPGRVFAIFAAYSRWVHLSTNTLPFYNVYPRLQEQFGTHDFNTFGSDQSPANHWMHETLPDKEKFYLANRMARWLRSKDGAHVLLQSKSELGSMWIPERGFDPNTGTRDGEVLPEHVHYD